MMKKIILLLGMTLVEVTIAGSVAVAAGTDATSLYPELNVSPRATERLRLEAAQEDATRWSNVSPFMVSGVMTLASGLYNNSKLPDGDKDTKDATWARQISMGVGAGWVIASYMIAENYMPYTQALGDLRPLPARNMGEQLTRERLAEEKIDDAAQMGRRLMLLSILTNAGANIFQANHSSPEGSTFASVAIATSFAPLFFRTRWQTVQSYHQDYKKRIYGPIASATYLASRDSRTGESKMVPGLALFLTF